MARREVPTRQVLIANQQKIEQIYKEMQESFNSESKSRDSFYLESHPYGAFQEHLNCIVCFELAREPFSCPKC